MDRLESGYFLWMDIRPILALALLFSCSAPPPKPIVMPPTKKGRPDLVQATVYSLGYLSDYDIWETLRENPSEKDVLEIFGLPDSVWLDDVESTKFLYYFMSEMQDYNTIEINTKTDSVSGFEWD